MNFTTYDTLMHSIFCNNSHYDTPIASLPKYNRTITSLGAIQSHKYTKNYNTKENIDFFFYKEYFLIGVYSLAEI